MAANPERASLVVQEHRFTESPSLAASAAIRAKFDKAPLIEITTNLDAAGAQALADEISGQVSGSTERRTFTFEIDRALTPKELISGLPRYILDFARHKTTGTGTYTLVHAQPLFDRNITIVKVRAS